jgi:hypothetical protein
MSEINEDILANLFQTRDVEGNESDVSESSSEEDFEPESEPQSESENGPEDEDTEINEPGDGDIELDQPGDGDTELWTKTRQALEFLDDIGFSTIGLLNGLNWGNKRCIQDARIRNARTSLLRDSQLPIILQRWHTPPRSSTSKKARPQGARDVMNKFAAQSIQNTILRELKSLSPKMKLPPPHDVEHKNLVKTGFENLQSDMKKHAPTLWQLLVDVVSYRKRKKASKDFKKVR